MVQFLREQMKKNSKEEWKNREITSDGSSNSTWRIGVKWGVDEVMATRSDVASLGDWWTEDDNHSMNQISLYLNHRWTSSISSFFVWETLLVARDQIHKDISSITMRESIDRREDCWSPLIMLDNNQTDLHDVDDDETKRIQWLELRRIEEKQWQCEGWTR